MDKKTKIKISFLIAIFIIALTTLILVLTQKRQVVNADATTKSSTSTTQQNPVKDTTHTTKTTEQISESTSNTTTTKKQRTTSTTAKQQKPDVAPTPTPNIPIPPVTYSNIKGVWISYLDMASYKNMSESAFTSAMSNNLNSIKNHGLNTVILQVRSHSDAIYPSNYYPWSKYITSSVNSGLVYDPLAITVSLAHSKGLSVHAWINPYRVMTTSDLENISNSYLIKQWYNSSSRSNYMIYYNSYWYLKPGNSEVQKLIIDGVGELVSNYNIDAIHIDDYFYATNPSEYGDTTVQAKNNTTALVRGIFLKKSAINSKVLFGISPTGRFDEGSTLPHSDKDYHSTDLNLWCNSYGYIDYVMPQIYWKRGHLTQDFSRVLLQWRSFVKSNSVALYTGLALYKESPSEGYDPFPDGEIRAQINEIESTGYSSGFCLFRYGFLPYY